MNVAVRLYTKQTAAPKTCGSCAHFRRAETSPKYLEYAPVNGECLLTFPPWMKLLHTTAQTDKTGEFVENSTDWRRVEDTNKCSFWQASGQTYVKDEIWTV